MSPRYISSSKRKLSNKLRRLLGSNKKREQFCKYFSSSILACKDLSKRQQIFGHQDIIVLRMRIKTKDASNLVPSLYSKQSSNNETLFIKIHHQNVYNNSTSITPPRRKMELFLLVLYQLSGIYLLLSSCVLRNVNKCKKRELAPLLNKYIFSKVIFSSRHF